ncbi:YajQ family cyclic di-GMP-binding protein [Reinekea marina]|uniref:Nucleotide-binding protein ACFOND_08455 n=1 Tax=Reinekea marina TaxID=1310421 RepID=A0ABV7WUS9_9GAMM|nr:YajQ family cyclic di-GMP-binding protein [Reinekea marina]MBU2864021.1 YajQ family cyclic di-GMP-binding protein [Reinekea forsetii]MDN3648086.1 YajQ family cyclic di-GMP-binding protein [Reinekea marina]
MPTFDIVSEVDKEELRNAADNANRELATRFDFRGVEASIELVGDDTITLKCESDFQVRQLEEIAAKNCVKRGISAAFAEVEDEPVHVGKTFTLNMKFKNGLEQPTARNIVKLIKEKGAKVKASIQGDKVRVEGKKRDDLQGVMAMLREEKIEQDLQFNNFRD